MTRLIERISLGRAFGVDRLRADSTDRPRRGGAGIGGGLPHILHFAQKDAGGSQFGRGRARRVKISLRQCRFVQTKSRENAANHSLAELSGRAEKRNVFLFMSRERLFFEMRSLGSLSRFQVSSAEKRAFGAELFMSLQTSFFCRQAYEVAIL